MAEINVPVMSSTNVTFFRSNGLKMIAVYFRVIRLKALSAESLLFAAFFGKIKEQTISNFGGLKPPQPPGSNGPVKESLPTKGALFREVLDQIPTHVGGTYTYPQIFTNLPLGLCVKLKSWKTAKGVAGPFDFLLKTLR